MWWRRMQCGPRHRPTLNSASDQFLHSDEQADPASTMAKARASAVCPPPQGG
jgi:hypothetical protein